MELIQLTNFHFLSILQLTSPALPVGPYSYSEGLEMLVENGTINDSNNLKDWLVSELKDGSIPIDTAVMMRGLQAANLGDCEDLKRWDLWLSAVRDTEE
jgi:urease accessory protein